MSDTETELRGGLAEAELFKLPTLRRSRAPRHPEASPFSSPALTAAFWANMDYADEATPQRRPRQQLSCVQCRRRKVKCDHERPCKRCRIRGWDAQCTYPLHIPPGPADSGSEAASPRRNSLGRDWRTASPSIATRPPISHPVSPLASAYTSPSEQIDLATPESLSGGFDTIYGYLHRRSSHSAAPQRTISEPAPLATPASTSSRILPQPLSICEQNTSATLQSEKPSVPASNLAYEPRPAEDHALYLINGETVYFGRSSAPWLISKFGNIMSYIHSDETGWHKSERVSVIRIKRLTSQQLLLAQDQDDLPPDALYLEVPTREIVDMCVSNYFQSIERMYPLFDGPKFWSEYESFWQAPTQARLVFVVILLLVICAGNGTILNDERPIPRSKVVRWWRLGLTWQGAASETNERMLSTIQASFLVVLLRQMYSLSETAEWVSSGALVKNALAMGLHRDPSKLYGIPPDEHELRRRLFYTVLELDLQYCLNAGMQPTLRIGDWDTALPAVVSETRNCCPGSSGQPHPTDAVSIQDRMLNSFNTRVEIACSVNAIIPEDNYDKVLDLTNKLSKSFYGLEKESRDCQTEALKFLHNRYLLTLHIPFSIDCDPKYAYSQNVSLTSALSILEQITSVPATPEQRQQHQTASASNSPDSNRNSPIGSNNRAENICTTALHASGMLFKNAGLYAALYLCHELIRDEHDGTLPPGPSRPPHANTTMPHFSPVPSQSSASYYHRTPNLVRTLPSVSHRVVTLIDRFVKIAEERLRTTQFAGKAFLIPRMVLAYHRISADPEVRTSEEKERRLLEAGKVIAEICFSIFCSNPDVAKVL